MNNLIKLEHKLIEEIKSGKPDSSLIRAYQEKLEKFVHDGKNVCNPDHYEAVEHLNLILNYQLVVEDQKSHQVCKPADNFQFRTKIQISREEIETRIDAIIDQNYLEYELQLILTYLANETYISSYELRQFYQLRKLQREREDFTFEVKRDVDELVQLENKRLALDEFIPSQLANLIYQFSDDLKVRPEACLTSLIVGLSACHKVGSELVIRRASNFVQLPNLFGAIVAPSGMRKSPLYRTFASKPLMRLQYRLLTNYKELERKYFEDSDRYDSLDSETRLIEFPEGKPRFINRKPMIAASSFTTQGIYRQYDSYSEQGIICVRDELKGLFGSFNQFSGGKGSDRQDLLSLYDGDSISELRAEGLVSNAQRTPLSILGTIQPEVLQEILGNGNDDDGLSARFLYCWQPLTASELPISDGQVNCDLNDVLYSLYSNLNALPVREYQLSKNGYQIFRAYNNYLGQKMITTANPGLQKAFAKGAGICARLAINLHVIDEILDSDRDAPMVVLDDLTIKKAINLTEFYLSQVKFLNKVLCQDDNLAPHFLKIIELSKRIGFVNSRDVKRNIWALRNSEVNDIRTWFSELENLSYGHCEGRGSRLRFNAI
jgi:hypothetical protein